MPTGNIRRARGEQRVLDLVSGLFLTHLKGTVLAQGELTAIVDRIAARDGPQRSIAGGIGQASG